MSGVAADNGHSVPLGLKHKETLYGNGNHDCFVCCVGEYN